MRLWLFVALLLAAVLGHPQRASAHDGLPVTASIEERSPGLYRLRIVLPPAVPMAVSPKVRLSPPCRLRETGGGLFACPASLDRVRLEIEWPSGKPAVPTIVRLRWRDGQKGSVLASPGKTSIDLPKREEVLPVLRDYLKLGLEHIGTGWDHLLFLLCLTMIAGTPRRIVRTVTGFTLGHAVTITAASLGYVGLAAAPVEASIALSIMILAAEVLRGDRTTLSWRYPMLMASCFGVLHGFGFASALTAGGLPRTETAVALIGFNVGIELGQLAVIASFFALATAARRVIGSPGELWSQRLAMATGSVAAFWFIERLPALGA